MPCLIELGAASKEVHRRIGEAMAAFCNLAVITTKDYFKEIRDGALSAGFKAGNILFLEKPAAIRETIENSLSAGDAILLEGRSSKAITDILTKKHRYDAIFLRLSHCVPLPAAGRCWRQSVLPSSQSRRDCL